MTTSVFDTVSVKGLVCDCEIGFHDIEKDRKQRIEIDFDMEVLPSPNPFADQISALNVDYFVASLDVKKHLESKAFNLIETLAEEVARRLLEGYRISAVTVTVTKHPLDMPHVNSVAYRCRRIRKT